MTTLSIVAVGRMKPGPMADLFGEYRKRLVWKFSLIEVEARGATKEAEAVAIRARLPANAVVVVLDERGQNIASPTLAAWIGERMNEGAPHIAFLIGGADGLDADLRSQAKLVLALGALTWPHMLARVMLVEQLYRAQQILAGHPYHRG